MDQAYVLDRGEREFDRLDLQGILYRDATRSALSSAGVSEGMRVLDVGCGSGDVTRMAAELVGPAGAVLGVDLDAGSIQSARTRCAQLGGPHSFPHSELYDSILRWKCRVVASAGADLEAGLRLYQTFQAARLPAPELRMEAPTGGGQSSLIYRYMEESMRSMLPMAEKNGIDGFSAERVENIEVSLRNDVLASDGVLICWPVVSAWCRLAD